MLLRNKKFLAAGLTCTVLLISAGCSSSSTSPTHDDGRIGFRPVGVQDVHRRAADGRVGTRGLRSRPRRCRVSRPGSAWPPPWGTRSSTSWPTRPPPPPGRCPGHSRWWNRTTSSPSSPSPRLFFSAAPYLTQQGIPVVGAAFDSTEWLSPKSYNMFSVIGNQDYTKVYTTTGLFLKSQGVTNLGSVGLLGLPELSRRGQGVRPFRLRRRASSPATSTTASRSAAPTWRRWHWP